MKTLYGVQLGNYLKIKENNQVIRVNSMTKKKIGFISGTEEKYLYTQRLVEIPIDKEILEFYLDTLDDHMFVDSGELVFIPKGTTNTYKISYFHELQNILELHNLRRIKWWEEELNQF